MTPRERQVLAFIERYQANHGGTSPTLQEIADGLGLKNRANVQQFVNGLARQGCIERRASGRRGITLVKSPTDLSVVSDGALLTELARRGLLKIAERNG